MENMKTMSAIREWPARVWHTNGTRNGRDGRNRTIADEPVTKRNSSPIVAAALFTAAGAAAVYLGSGRLVHFDWALTGYAVGTLAACFATAWRFAVWTQRPPSRVYFRRGWELLFRRSHRTVSATP